MIRGRYIKKTENDEDAGSSMKRKKKKQLDMKVAKVLRKTCVCILRRGATPETQYTSFNSDYDVEDDFVFTTKPSSL